MVRLLRSAFSKSATVTSIGREVNPFSVAGPARVHLASKGARQSAFRFHHEDGVVLAEGRIKGYSLPIRRPSRWSCGCRPSQIGQLDETRAISFADPHFHGS